MAPAVDNLGVGQDGVDQSDEVEVARHLVDDAFVIPAGQLDQLVHVALAATIGIICLLPFAAVPLPIGFSPTFLDLALVALLVVWLFRMAERRQRDFIATPVALPLLMVLDYIEPTFLLAFISFAASVGGLTLGMKNLMGVCAGERGKIHRDATGFFRHVEEKGEEPVTAAHAATSEIMLAVTATTLSLAVIFVSLAFMGGMVFAWLGSAENRLGSGIPASCSL